MVAFKVRGIWVGELFGAGLGLAIFEVVLVIIIIFLLVLKVFFVALL